MILGIILDIFYFNQLIIIVDGTIVVPGKSLLQELTLFGDRTQRLKIRINRKFLKLHC